MDEDYYDPYAEEEETDATNTGAPAEGTHTDLATITKEYDLPDNLATAPPLEAIGALPIEELYETLAGLQRQVADSSRIEALREYLKEHPEYAVALFQVLHESGLAKIAEGTEEDDLNAALGLASDDAMMELPPADAPPLPPGATTWLGKPRQRPAGQ